MRQRAGLRWALRLAGPLLLILILVRTDLNWFLERLSQLPIPTLLAAIALTLPIVGLRAWRWRIFLPQPRPAPMESLRIYAVGALLGALTPAQIGEFGKVFSPLSSGSGGAASLFWATLLDRLSDLVVVLLGAAILLLVYQPFKGAAWLPIGGLALCLAALPLCFKPGFRAWSLHKTKHLWQRVPTAWRQAYPRLSASRVLGGLALSTLAWLLNWAAIWLTATAMGLAIPFFFLAGALCCAALFSMLPITILGMGTRDAALIVLLAPLDIDTPSALALSSIVLFLRIIYAVICALASWTPDRKK